MRNMQVEPLTPSIGAEIHGVDLASNLTEDEVGAIRDALLTHLVVFFRDQRLDARSLDTLGRRFGEPHTHYAAPEGVEGFQSIIPVHADADTRANNGGGWHSDNSFDEVPPMGSIMHLHTAPELGGDTLWANMYDAYDALSEPMRSFLEGLTARHDSGPPFRRLFGMTEENIEGGSFNAATHPCVRVHPETGKKALYVSPYFTSHIVELDSEENEAVMSFIARHIEQPRFHCRFRWSINAVAFWDNRATQHRALWDYYPATRTGNRYTVAGEPVS